MFRRCVLLAFCLVFSVEAVSTANAQGINYRGYATGTGTGFGCAFLPSYNTGQAFVKNFTATYVSNGVTRSAQLYYGSYFQWNGYVYNWQVLYMGPNVEVTVTLEYGFTNDPGPTYQVQTFFVCPPDPVVGGWYAIPSC